MGKKLDVYQIVTDLIIEKLDQGVAMWNRPWSVELHKNLSSNREYRGINQLLCEMYMMENSYGQPLWLTYNGAKKLGGNVRKGEKGHIVVLWKQIVVEDDEAPEGKRTIWLLRYFKVFNIEQTDGIELPEKEVVEIVPNKEAEKLIKGYKDAPKVTMGGNRAFYSPPTDKVGMPNKTKFVNMDAYYCTLFHEFIHSTGHKSRLDRKEVMETKEFGSEDYSREELVAELGSAMLAGVCGLDPSNVERSSSYIDSWRQKLSDDKKIILQAASRAAKAADYIRDVEPQKYEEEN